MIHPHAGRCVALSCQVVSCPVLCHRSAAWRLAWKPPEEDPSCCTADPIVLGTHAAKDQARAVQLINAWPSMALASSASARLRPADPSSLPSRTRARLTFQRSPREAPDARSASFPGLARHRSNHNRACYRSVTVTTDEAERRVSTGPSVYVL